MESYQHRCDYAFFVLLTGHVNFFRECTSGPGLDDLTEEDIPDIMRFFVDDQDPLEILRRGPTRRLCSSEG